MIRRKEESLKCIRDKLKKQVLLRTEINNIYIEKYIDEVVSAIIDEIYAITESQIEQIADSI